MRHLYTRVAFDETEMHPKVSVVVPILNGAEYVPEILSYLDDQTYRLAETPMIYWSLDPEDWKVLDTAKVVERILGEVEDGDIILLHDFYPTSVEAALQVVDALQGKGYQFLTVAELFDRFGTDPQPGVLYADATHPRGW